jgi:hypothetical protein
MKNSNHFTLLSFLLALTIISVSCRKEINSKGINSEVQQERDTNELVLTPEGYYPRSRVHGIEQGYEVILDNGHYKKMNSLTKEIIVDFGEASVSDQSILSMRKNLNHYSKPIPGVNDAQWITYAEWENNTINPQYPISYIATSWKVPNPPTTFSPNEAIFIFDGLTDLTNIMQPVLQYGVTAAGGGNYWAIDNWWVTPRLAFYTPNPQRVTTGTQLQGIISLTSQSGNNFSYRSSFYGYPTLNYNVSNVNQLNWAEETFEVWNNEVNTDFPPDQFMKMNNIDIYTVDYPASLSWVPHNPYIQNGQKTIIVSNNSTGQGEVDIYFQPCPILSQIQNPNWNNSTLTLSWSAVSGASQYEMIINSSPSGRDNGAFYNTTATSIPNFFNTIEANNTPGNYQVLLIPQDACGNGPLLYYNFTH